MFRFYQPLALRGLLCAICLHTTFAFADNTTEYFDETIQTTAKQLQSRAIETISHLSQQGENTASVSEPTQITLAIFPLKSGVLTPAVVSPQRVSLPALHQPIFIVGSDALSQNWLQQHVNQLTALHAIGFLVQADSEADFTMMQQLAGGLPLLPINADAFAVQWGVKHYPALITAHGVGI